MKTSDRGPDVNEKVRSGSSGSLMKRSDQGPDVNEKVGSGSRC